LLPRPGLRAGSGLPAADAGLCGSLNPTRSLLPKRLLPPARRWGDGSLFLGMGASCAGSAPGALSTAGPLGVRGAPLLPRGVRRLRCLLLLPAPLPFTILRLLHLQPLERAPARLSPPVNWSSGPAPTSPAHSATGPPIPSVGPQAQTLSMRGSVVRSHHG